MDATEPTCANCRHWLRYSDDSDVGICTSVLNNEYSRAVLMIEGRSEQHPVVLQTNEDFGCADWDGE